MHKSEAFYPLQKTKPNEAAQLMQPQFSLIIFSSQSLLILVKHTWAIPKQKAKRNRRKDDKFHPSQIKSKPRHKKDLTKPNEAASL